jgi:hypothetical protein
VAKGGVREGEGNVGEESKLLPGCARAAAILGKGVLASGVLPKRDVTGERMHERDGCRQEGEDDMLQLSFWLYVVGTCT